MLSLLFGATTYTFSLILAVFLVGLGIGSSLARRWRAALANPRIALGWCQLALVRGARVGGLRHGRVAAVLADQSVDLDRSLVVQLPARSDAGDLGDAARRDSLGRELPAGARRGGRARAGLGAAGRRRLRRQHASAPSSARWSPASCWSGTVGSQMTQQILIGIAALSGLLMLMPATGEVRKPLTSTPRRRDRRRAAGAGLLARVGAAAAVACSSPTAATRRRGSGRTRSSTSAKASPRRSPSRARRAAC